MSPYELNGPWTGAALRDRPPLPYSIQRRRRTVRVFLAVLAILSIIGGCLAALSNWQAPQI